MLALKIIAILVLILFLFGQIRVGADISYVDQKLVVSAKCCGVLLQIFPRKGARRKKQKQREPVSTEEKPPEEKKQKKEKPKKQKKGPGLMICGEDLSALLKKVLQGLGRFNSGFHVDRFLLRWTAAGSDPYDTARLFAAVNAILSSAAPYCAERFRCRNTEVRTEIDFTSSEMKLDFGLAVVLRIGAVFSMLFTILFGTIGILIRNRLYWARLRRTDPEEYAFRVENPCLITKLIRSLLEKKNTPEENRNETPDGEMAESTASPQPQIEANNPTEQERKSTNGE